MFSSTLNGAGPYSRGWALAGDASHTVADVLPSTDVTRQNASVEPSGDSATAPAGPFCTSSGLPPTRLTAQTSLLLRKPMRDESGHQNAPLAFTGSRVSCTGVSESRLRTKICSTPSTNRENAIILPSGDHAGPYSGAASAANDVNR